MTEPQDIAIEDKWGKPSPFHEPQLLAGFQPRSSDVLITTPPKAGTTWMQQILHQIRSKGDDSFRSIYDVVPWLELRRQDISIAEQLAQYEAMESPRIFKTHCTYSQTPGVDTAKIILTSRDPRDCCISFYHHMQGLTDEVKKERGMNSATDFDTFFENWMSFAAWYRNVQSWWPHRHQANILWLRYEDMKLVFSKAIDQICDFLEWSLTPYEKERVMGYASFEWMKENTHRFTTLAGYEKPHFKPGQFIRKGVVGDYKMQLSAEQEARILAKAKELLEADCLRFLGLADSV